MNLLRANLFARRHASYAGRTGPKLAGPNPDPAWLGTPTTALGTDSLGTDSLGTDSPGTDSLGTESPGTDSLGTLLPASPPTAPPTAPPGWTPGFWHDRVLLSAFAICGLLIGYQLTVTLLRPPWSGPVTDWLRAVLAWPELLTVVGVSLWLSRARHPAALSWWMWSAALLSYTIARSVWTVDDQLVFHHGVPFPTFPDLFFVLQYPFFFLAVILLPRTRFWGSLLILAVDGLLVMGAATALSREFILEPIYTANGMSPLARSVSLAYPVGDLFVLAALTMTLLRPSRYRADRLVLAVLVVAVLCLITADSWVAWLLRAPPHVYTTGDPPDLFWLAFDLLIALASVVQWRIARYQARVLPTELAVTALNRQRVQWQDITASLRLFVPIVVALLASAVLLMHITMAVAHLGWRHEIGHLVVPFVLLLLVVLRQELVFLENAQLRREREVARATELALLELNRRKDEFLVIVAHELKTPMTSLQGYLELLARRFRPHEAGHEAGGAAGGPAARPAAAPIVGADDPSRTIALARTVIVYCLDSLQRITRLIDDLLDSARSREGRLTFHPQPCDLSAIVRKAVEEQRLLAPDRAIRLEVPTPPEVPVVADAPRIEQVVTNYLTNALKYSKADRPVAVRVAVEGALDGAVPRVSVRDEGIGVPASAQAHVWERFYRVEGVEVQSGSGVSLGIGLYLSKTIIDRHHGQVGLDSVPGQGSTFWFTLPLAYSPREP